MSLFARSVMIVAVSSLAAAGCQNEPPPYFQGYAEGEFVRVAAPFAGSLTRLAVKRGDQVKPGDFLYALEQENEAAARREAGERLERAQAQLENLKRPKRAPELAAIRAEIAQAQASLELSLTQLARQQKLLQSGFISESRLDEARTAYERDRARVAELNAQLSSARLPVARPDEIKAAQAEVDAAHAQLAQAEWRLKQKSVSAPQAGLVEDTLYVEGEWVPAGSPVVSLLPPQNIKLRFFVPEEVLGSLKIGEEVNVHCDGCGNPIPARISFISSQAEFTPPVIYSRETRSKLVFLIQARPHPEEATRLHPGQPVEVRVK
jgi:HlyD family secretion protein